MLMRGIADPCPAVKTTDLCAVHTLSKKKNVFFIDGNHRIVLQLWVFLARWFILYIYLMSGTVKFDLVHLKNISFEPSTGISVLMLKNLFQNLSSVGKQEHQDPKQKKVLFLRRHASLWVLSRLWNIRNCDGLNICLRRMFLQHASLAREVAQCSPLGALASCRGTGASPATAHYKFLPSAMEVCVTSEDLLSSVFEAFIQL